MVVVRRSDCATHRERRSAKCPARRFLSARKCSRRSTRSACSCDLRCRRQDREIGVISSKSTVYEIIGMLTWEDRL